MHKIFKTFEKTDCKEEETWTAFIIMFMSRCIIFNHNDVFIYVINSIFSVYLWISVKKHILSIKMNNVGGLENNYICQVD